MKKKGDNGKKVGTVGKHAREFRNFKISLSSLLRKIVGKY